MLKKIVRLGSRGDTIIEVMIAIAVITSVLGLTFATSNRSQKATQANHERYQAQLFLNEQAEMIKSAAGPDRNAFMTQAASNNTFCMVNGVFKDETDSGCTKQGLYKVTVTAVSSCSYIQSPCASPSVFNNYFIKVQWNSFINRGDDQVELGYGI